MKQKTEERPDMIVAGTESEAAAISDARVPTANPAPDTEKTAENTGGFCVYLGPSIHGVILKGTIFSADKKATLTELESAVKKYPLVAALIVSGDALPESRIKVKTPGNLLYENYRKLAGRITSK